MADSARRKRWCPRTPGDQPGNFREHRAAESPVDASAICSDGTISGTNDLVPFHGTGKPVLLRFRRWDKATAERKCVLLWSKAAMVKCKVLQVLKDHGGTVRKEFPSPGGVCDVYTSWDSSKFVPLGE